MGLRRSLLGGLGSYAGEVVEIATAEEWDELQRMLRLSGEFGVRFFVDDEHAWSFSLPLCQVCDPLVPVPVVPSSAVRPAHRVAVLIGSA